MNNIKIRFSFLLFGLVLLVCNVHAGNDFASKSIINPFSVDNYSSGLLSYDKFNMHHLFMFSSVFGNNKSLYSGVYLNSIEYKISPYLTSIVHLGEKANYFSFSNEKNNTKDFVYGGTLLYKPSNSFKIKVEYGTTSDSLQNNFEFYPQPEINKNMRVWLSKKFGKSTSLFISVQYNNFNK